MHNGIWMSFKLFRNFLCALKQIFLTSELLKPALLQLLRIYWYIFNRRPVDTMKTLQSKAIAQYLNECFQENIHICQNMKTNRLWGYFCPKRWRKHVIFILLQSLFKCIHRRFYKLECMPFSFGEFPISIVPAALGRRTEQMHIRYTTLFNVDGGWTSVFCALFIVFES